MSVNQYNAMKVDCSSRVIALFLGLLTHSSYAGGVNWGSSLGDTASDSQGEALTSSWTFYLGHFSEGFSPSSANTASWSSQWTTVDISEYEPEGAFFGGAWSNDGDSVSVAQKGYIWGLNRGSEDNQWVLMTADDWVFPMDSPINPNVNWFTPDVTEVVIGEYTEGLLVTAATEGEPAFLFAEQWLEWQFDEAQLLNDSISGWEADPDGDGHSNLEEFAFGNDPQQADVVRVEAEVVNGVFRWSCPRVRNGEVVYFGRVSSDLNEWSEESSDVILDSVLSSRLIFRDLTPVGEGPRFGAVRVALIP